ncbi:hypothetical protein K933_12860 [Candidatus Halobonum tyrrellensis G22]|uniref:Uncharacterized protein n=2 Tax=Candidatus Halobonum TaxID=1431544 RepID=V4GRM6_9EURY|nr:hypothetical protein K933_12860 [Candidatus Halobonum tyrrellensis G22]
MRLAVVLALVVLAAGCLDGTPGGTPTATPTPTPTGSVTSTTPTGTFPGSEHAADRPEPSHPVTLSNRWNRSVEMRVTVVREATDGTVHEATYDVPAGSERAVYDTAEADPDGVEAFTVTVSARNATQSVTIESSQCYGDVYAEVGADGDLFVTYAVC